MSGISKVLALILGLVMSFAANACNINFSIELQTFGENVTVDLRTGAPGRSRLVSIQRSQGGQVTFDNLCPGSYFLAIGNDDSVSVTPVSQFAGAAKLGPHAVVALELVEGQNLDPGHPRPHEVA